MEKEKPSKPCGSEGLSLFGPRGESKEIPRPAQFPPQGGNGALVDAPRRPPRAGIQRSESGPKAKKFPVQRSFRHKAETER